MPRPPYWSRRYAHIHTYHAPILPYENVVENEWDSFHAVAQGLAKRTSHAYPINCRPVVVISNDDQSTAWAYSDAGYGPAEPLIVINKGLITELQFIAGQAAYMAEHMLRSEASDVLREIWAGLPVAETDLERFAALLAHVAIAVVTHHEIAHISLGHLQFHQKAPAGTSETGQAWCIDEAAVAGAALQARANAKYGIIQALEMDADVHALQWTRSYLEDMSARHLESPVSEDPVTNAVWSTVLTSHLGRRFLLVGGFSLLFLSLSARDFKINSLQRRTHPPSAIRLASLVEVEANLSGRPTSSQVVPRMTEAVRMALGSWASHMRIASAENGTNPELDTATWTLDRAMEASGLATAFQDWGSVKGHLRRLAAYRREVDEKLQAERLLPAAYGVDWYSMGEID